MHTRVPAEIYWAVLMAHDAQWCYRYTIQVFEFRVPETGERFTLPVTEQLIASSDPGRLHKLMLRKARGSHPSADFRRRMAPQRTEDGGYEWCDVLE